MIRKAMGLGMRALELQPLISIANPRPILGVVIAATFALNSLALIIDFMLDERFMTKDIFARAK
ncbi:MAG: hypothetical protein COW00_18010 [Bdellovibrio sp. CG12_big_fil_rev_8_21_14_0_65_39_13]|nr:MAG: hypothetical protein COW78_06160 [Bdellovibrio sp. CG22_combo_CG10-13_8_21_14_all_39_27]PIQ58004.1 MAG: hypothetical protein COW00_18010 [Bdellovibrio sp. CG12_big_fil_rev_8_21_14_0_65_39_13]PIR36914.1 MAG: hypothetical protein COV37_00040 [Bdellovibrio sp. CG11_big_fil_rev_8_21_14_0_20_39_38]